MLENHPSKIAKTKWTAKAFVRCGRPDLVRLFLDRTPVDAEFDANDTDVSAAYGHLMGDGCTERAIDYAAGNEHFELLKWLHRNRTEVTVRWTLLLGMVTWRLSNGYTRTERRAVLQMLWTVLLEMGTWKSCSGCISTARKVARLVGSTKRHRTGSSKL